MRDAQLRELTIASRTFLEAPPDEFAEHPLVRQRGSLTIARADQADALEAELARARAHVPSITRITPAEVLRMVPVLRPEAVAFAMLEPDCRDIDVDALLGGYRRGLLAAGGRIVTDARTGRIVRDGTAWQVTTGNGRFSAPALVNAAGAWADEVARLAGACPVGLVPKRRTAISVDAPGSVSWPMVNDVAEELYFKPDAGRLLVSPADATPSPPCDAQPEELDVAIAVDRLLAATTLDVRRVAHRWAGLRSFVADHAPVIGEATQRGLYWLAGQGGFGVMTSPALSSLAAGAVLGKPVPAALSCHRVSLALRPADALL